MTVQEVTSVPIVPRKIPIAIPPKNYFDLLVDKLRLRALINESQVVDARHFLDSITTNVAFLDRVRGKIKTEKDSSKLKRYNDLRHESFYIEDQLKLVICDNLERDQSNIWNPTPLTNRNKIQTSPFLTWILEAVELAEKRGRTISDLNALDEISRVLKENGGCEKELARSLTKMYISPYTEEDTLQEINLVKDLLLTKEEEKKLSLAG